MATLHTRKQEISGRQVWTGSMVLAHALFQLPDTQKRRLLENKTILELGSGTGILGMAVSKICTAGHYVPSALILTDGDVKAISLLQTNLENPVNAVNAHLVRATRLLWGTTESSAIQCPDFCDWCRINYPSVWNTSSGTDVVFDTIFAGDVLYKEDLPKLFFETAFALLSKSGHDDSSLWLCHIPRHGISHEMVVDSAISSGLSVEKPIDMSFIAAVRGCSPDDVRRAIIYRMHIDKDR
jgi:predicted nicotinamide N-methyase